MKNLFELAALQNCVRQAGQFIWKHEDILSTLAVFGGLYACGGILRMAAIPAGVSSAGLCAYDWLGNKRVYGDIRINQN